MIIKVCHIRARQGINQISFKIQGFPPKMSYKHLRPFSFQCSSSEINKIIKFLILFNEKTILKIK